MSAMPTLNMRDFADLLTRSDRYPFYCVLLYTPMNGLDEKMHKYAVSRWFYLNSLTGRNCLLIAVEDPEHNKDITEFKPEDVYEIARYLGASVRDLPCMAFFTDPQNRDDTLILKLREVLPEPGTLTEDEITEFFRTLQSIIDSCSDRETDARLECLRNGLKNEGPEGSRSAEAASKLSTVGGWLVKSVTSTSTIVEAISKIVTILGPFVR